MITASNLIAIAAASTIALIVGVASEAWMTDRNAARIEAAQ